MHFLSNWGGSPPWLVACYYAESWELLNLSRIRDSDTCILDDNSSNKENNKVSDILEDDRKRCRSHPFLSTFQGQVFLKIKGLEKSIESPQKDGKRW